MNNLGTEPSVPTSYKWPRMTLYAKNAWNEGNDMEVHYTKLGTNLGIKLRISEELHKKGIRIIYLMIKH